MESGTKTLLIILAFVVITILVFKPFHSCSVDPGDTLLDSEEERETYNASFDFKYADPRVNPYSRDVTFRPDTNDMYGLDDPANNDPNKLFDHLNDQHGGIGRPEFQNNSENLRSIDTNPESTNGIRSRFHPMSSSYTNTEIDNDIVRESNNIGRYCVNTSPLVGVMGDDKGNILPDGIDRPYSAIIDDISEEDMDMDNKQYYDLISGRSGQRTYIQIDDAFGRFNQNAGDGRVKDVEGLGDITNVMDTYRNNTLYSISGGYRNGRSAVGSESDKKMYDMII
jgi:hypothetical protein